MKVTRFEDLDCWKAARMLVTTTYEMTRMESFSKDYGLRDQIRRAAISVMANIAEGFAAFSGGDFVRFLDYSIRSAVEVESHLYVARDLNYITQNDFDNAYERAEACVSLCRGFIRYLKERI